MAGLAADLPAVPDCALAVADAAAAAAAAFSSTIVNCTAGSLERSAFTEATRPKL